MKNIPNQSKDSEALKNEKWLKNLEEAYKENGDADLAMAEALAPVSAEVDKISLEEAQKEDLS